MKGGEGGKEERREGKMEEGREEGESKERRGTKKREKKEERGQDKFGDKGMIDGVITEDDKISKVPLTWTPFSLAPSIGWVTMLVKPPTRPIPSPLKPATK